MTWRVSVSRNLLNRLNAVARMSFMARGPCSSVPFSRLPQLAHAPSVQPNFRDFLSGNRYFGSKAPSAPVRAQQAKRDGNYRDTLRSWPARSVDFLGCPATSLLPHPMAVPPAQKRFAAFPKLSLAPRVP